jgi:hypothetical protein
MARQAAQRKNTVRQEVLSPLYDVVVGNQFGLPAGPVVFAAEVMGWVWPAQQNDEEERYEVERLLEIAAA